MTTQKLDIPFATQQQVFSLSWLAGSASTGNNGQGWSRQNLQDALDAIKANIGSWQVVWGPNYSRDLVTQVPVNTMYIAQQRDSGDNLLPVYVIAVAGTNPNSIWDQFQDLDITPTDWLIKGNVGAPGVQVTHGDWKGLTNVLAMQDDLLNLFSNVLGYLSLNISNKSGVTLYFTGHSMGGALAPMLMLALMDPNSVLDTSASSLSHWQQVNLLATAGPSVGNAAYNAYFYQVLGASNVSTNFIWNGKDVVPHAWDKKTMNEVMTKIQLNSLRVPDPTNYATLYNISFLSLPVEEKDSVRDLILSQQNAAAAQQYAQINPTPAFTHPLQSYAQSATWTPDAKFMAQLGYQHLNAYIDHFQCNAWFPLSDPCANPPPVTPIKT